MPQAGYRRPSGAGCVGRLRRSSKPVGAGDGRNTQIDSQTCRPLSYAIKGRTNEREPEWVRGDSKARNQRRHVLA